MRLILRFLQFPVFPLNQRDLPAKVLRVIQRYIQRKRNKATPWKQEQ